MKITKEEVDKVAKLARLGFTEEEKEKFASQLNSILVYFDNLGELDTIGIEPTSHASTISNVFRDDKVESSISKEESLLNAPDGKRDCFRVPRIIE
ncbi:MAG: Asp-tRNA(Asn)/Glu-tRNA(Gln) amidotransferase subunit GatC [Desulfobacterales bacterium]|nr:Asp-tRNA(Asn)/Glu-tRNA(Gln) amidotransferase subunit GatC [Desulfobacterales bacterium]